MMEDVGARVLREVEELEGAVLRTRKVLHQFIREKKRDKKFDVERLPVGGVVSLTFSLLPEVRRQLKFVRNWLRGLGAEVQQSTPRITKREVDQDHHIHDDDGDSYGLAVFVPQGERTGSCHSDQEMETELENLLGTTTYILGEVGVVVGGEGEGQDEYEEGVGDDDHIEEQDSSDTPNLPIAIALDPGTDADDTSTTTTNKIMTTAPEEITPPVKTHGLKEKNNEAKNLSLEEDSSGTSILPIGLDTEATITTETKSNSTPTKNGPVSPPGPKQKNDDVTTSVEEENISEEVNEEYEITDITDPNGPEEQNIPPQSKPDFADSPNNNLNLPMEPDSGAKANDTTITNTTPQEQEISPPMNSPVLKEKNGEDVTNSSEDEGETQNLDANDNTTDTDAANPHPEHDILPPSKCLRSAKTFVSPPGESEGQGPEHAEEDDDDIHIEETDHGGQDSSGIHKPNHPIDLGTEAEPEATTATTNTTTAPQEIGPVSLCGRTEKNGKQNDLSEESEDEELENQTIDTDNTIDSDLELDPEDEIPPPSKRPRRTNSSVSLSPTKAKKDPIKNKNQCEKCGEIFKNGFARTRHLSKPPCGKKVEYKCPECHKVLSRQDKLNNHIRNLHTNTAVETATRPLPVEHECPECHLVLARRDKLNNHIRYVHGSTPTAKAQTAAKARSLSVEHKCPECHKVLSRHDKLNNHMRNVHGSTSTPEAQSAVPVEHKCPECDTVLAKQGHLERHILRFHSSTATEETRARAHLGDYKCPKCHRVLSRRDHFRRHMLRFHSNTSDKAKATEKGPATVTSTAKAPTTSKPPTTSSKPPATSTSQTPRKRKKRNANVIRENALRERESRKKELIAASRRLRLMKRNKVKEQT